MDWNYLVIPFMAALIGWMISGILIRFLFHPVQPKKFGGFTIQGVLPKFQPLMADKIGQLAGTELFPADVVEQKIANPENLEKVMPDIESHIDEFLRVKLGKEMPVIGMFIGDKTIDSMKKIFMQELATLFPEIMKKYAAHLRTGMDIEKMVRGKIATFPQDQLEKILYRVLSKEFRTIKITGAVMGFIIGLLQLLLTLVLF